MRRVETAARMVDDPDWNAPKDAADTARLVVDYLHGSAPLIPDWVPKVGHLDDAIVVDAAWPRLADEVEDYLDFCRARESEAQTRGDCSRAPVFNRDAWEQVRAEEVALLAHQRQVRERSYLAEPVPMFRVH
jgi:uncharacterized membrane protein YkvA (DUF1232 family)